MAALPPKRRREKHMHCTCCGAPVEAEAVFCPGCGARLDGQSAGEPVMAPVAEPVEQPIEQPVSTPEKAGVRPPRKKPHIALRILMQLVSLMLCFVLLGTALAAVMLLDLRALTSAGGIEKVVSSIFTVSPAPVRSPAAQSPVRVDPCAARPSDGVQLQLLSSRTAAQNVIEILYGGGKLELIAGDPELVTVYPQPDGSYYVAIEDGPEFCLRPQHDGSCVVETVDGLPLYVTPEGLVLDHLGEPAEWPFGDNVRLTYDPSLDSSSGQPDDTGSAGSTNDVSGALSEYIFRYYDQLQSQFGDDLPITRQQLQAMLAQPSVQSFLSEKASEYVLDILTGSENASISTDEIMELLEQNRELLESEFDITITPEVKQQLRSELSTLLEEQDLSSQLRENISKQLDSALSGSSGSWSDSSSQNSTLRMIQTVLSYLLSTRMLVGIVAVCLVLLALLCLANWYNIPAGLTWASVPCIFGGLIVTVPLLILRSQPRILLSALGVGGRALMNLLLSFTDVMLPVHCGLLIVGLLLLIASIVWRILRANHHKAA